MRSRAKFPRKPNSIDALICPIQSINTICPKHMTSPVGRPSLQLWERKEIKEPITVKTLGAQTIQTRAESLSRLGSSATFSKGCENRGQQQCKRLNTEERLSDEDLPLEVAPLTTLLSTTAVIRVGYPILQHLWANLRMSPVPQRYQLPSLFSINSSGVIRPV